MQTGGSKATRRLETTLQTPLQLANILNERFVALGELIDRATALGEQWFRRGVRRGGDGPRSELAGEEAGEAYLRRTRVRLSELHLRVGAKICNLGTTGTDAEVTSQLCLLLDEIDRLEDVLRRVGEGAADMTPDTDAQTEAVGADGVQRGRDGVRRR